MRRDAMHVCVAACAVGEELSRFSKSPHFLFCVISCSILLLYSGLLCPTFPKRPSHLFTKPTQISGHQYDPHREVQEVS